MILKKLMLPVMAAMVMLNVNGLHASEKETINNYQGTFECHPDVIHAPSTIEEIQDIVRDALADGRTIMTGNRKFRSQIDAACTENGQIQITMENMNQVVDIDEDAMTVKVQSGMRFNDLNEVLSEHQLAVNMVTELATFTIGGMLGSGTHGSTFQKKSNMIADYVIAMTIVDGLGNVRVITGEELNAARVNLGVLGVVVDATIQLEPQFKVSAKVKGYWNDKNLEDVILDIARDNYSANVAWFPGLGRYTTTLYNEEPLTAKGNDYNAQADVSDFQEYFFGLLFNGLHETRSPTLQCFAASMRYSARDGSYFRSLDTGFKSYKPVGLSHNMQHFTCREPDKCVWDKLPIALQEVAIPFEQLPNWIADVRKILDNNPKTCFPLNGIYFRFGKASDSYLGMSAGRDSAFVGIEYTLRKAGAAVPKHYFVNLEIEQMSLRKYGARPHWGKNSVAIFEDMPSRFPNWDKFIAFKEKVDPHNVFTNPFWERATGADPLTNYLKPGCNLIGECYCTEDSHCEEGTTCQSGGYFTDARVCK